MCWKGHCCGGGGERRKGKTNEVDHPERNKLFRWEHQVSEGLETLDKDFPQTCISRLDEWEWPKIGSCGLTCESFTDAYWRSLEGPGNEKRLEVSVRIEMWLAGTDLRSSTRAYCPQRVVSRHLAR